MLTLTTRLTIRSRVSLRIGFLDGRPMAFKNCIRGNHRADYGCLRLTFYKEMRETLASQQTNNSSMPPPSAPPVPIGTRVELHGLKAKPQLNGQYGIVVGYVLSSGRCTVVLEDARGETKTKMSIKPENLKWK